MLTLTHAQTVDLLSALHAAKSALATASLHTRHVATQDLCDANRSSIESQIAAIGEASRVAFPVKVDGNDMLRNMPSRKA